jgi:hypothetical protein
MENAAHCKVRYLQIPLPEVAALQRTMWAMYRELEGDDSRLRAWKGTLWKMGATAIHTLLPFQTESISLASLTSALVNDPMLPPAGREIAPSLSRAMRDLLRVEENPKWNAICDIASDCRSKRWQVAVLSSVTRRPKVEGWPEQATDLLVRGRPPIQFISAIPEIENQTLDVIVIPSGGRYIGDSLLSELRWGGHASELVFVAYDSEKFRHPVRPMWHTGRVVGQPVAELEPPEPKNTLGSEVAPEQPRWRWRSTPGSLALPDDRDLEIAARCILFEEDECTCLPASGRVIEVADLLAHSGDGADADHLPRKEIADLEVGDVIVMRRSGAGDYLDEVADDLMRRANESGLRRRTVEWKAPLQEMLRRLGPEAALQHLNRQGFTLEAGGGYLASYVSDVVIGPGTQERFASLIKGLAADGYITVTPLSQVIADQWQVVQDIRRYQRQAGASIRRELLQELNARIRAGDRLVGRPIAISGVQAGELTLLRIVDIDPEIRLVRASLLFRIRPAEQDWE